MTDYRPIACELHSQYELAIMQNRFVQVVWNAGADEVKQERLKPIDFLVSHGEEFLLLEQEDGNKTKIRLDHILKIADINIS
jgi:transcriptional antiterminator Rof (Rho-off)